MRIFISGLSDSPNPSPGAGIARSLRLAYPDADLIGVDYTYHSSGLHLKEFDEIWIQASWNDLDLHEYKEQIKSVLNEKAFWISGLDFETLWLADVLPDQSNLLIPSSNALNKTAKPAIPAHESLLLKIPPHISTSVSEWDIHTFCRKHGWRIWLRGSFLSERRIYNWSEFNLAQNDLAHRWLTDDLFLQAHITGYKEAIALTAFHGTLLGSVYMSKGGSTSEKGTGHISAVPKEILDPIRDIVRNLNWTGGAELEIIRDEAGELWLLEWIPRFPAWIFGATLAGQNLPGLLLEYATGVPMATTKFAHQAFTSVVLEIPIRPLFPLPLLPKPVINSFDAQEGEISPNMAITGKKIQRVNRSRTQFNFTAFDKLNLLTSILQDLDKFDFDRLQTPYWLFLDTTAQSIFKSAVEFVNRFRHPCMNISIAYSIKTNPDNRLIELTCNSGFLAEVISQLEVQKTIAEGLSPERLVLNGPGKWWPPDQINLNPVKAIFCDSIEELRRVITQVKDGRNLADVIGIRINPLGLRSRFGISVEYSEIFSELVSLIRRLPTDHSFGVHFHKSNDIIGMSRWWQLYKSMLRLAMSLEETTGRRIECFDMGGGWFPDDWASVLKSQFNEVISLTSQSLSNVKELILEPGRALAQPTMALAVRVLEVRRRQGYVKEVIVDGSIAELPEISQYPHHILLKDQRTKRWIHPGRGESRIAGRLCMEDDVLVQHISLPQTLSIGDVMVICDAGAYDRSTFYNFGQG